MRRQHRTKIVATLGPGTGDAKSIATLFHAGADVFRLNFSHGAHSEHKARLDAIRELERKRDRNLIAMMRAVRSNCGKAPPSGWTWTRPKGIPTVSPCPIRRFSRPWNPARTCCWTMAVSA